jgi:hypothetical protein
LEVILEISASRGDFAFANKLIFTAKAFQTIQNIQKIC